MTAAATLPFSTTEFEQRLANVRRKMAADGLRAFLTHSPENIYYLTGYQTAGYYMYQTLIVPDKGEPIILTRLLEEGNVLAASWVQNRAAYQDTQDPIEVTFRVLADAGLNRGRIGVEKDGWFLTVRHYEGLVRLLGPACELVDAGGLVESLRVVKTHAEIAYIRKAAAAANEGMRAGIEATVDGRTENDVAAAVHGAIIGAGGEYMSLPVFIGSGPRSYLPHATWDGRRMAKGELVHIELCGCVKRYSAALFRTMYLGSSPSKDIRAMSEACSAALNAVIEAIRPGVTAGEVDRASTEAFAGFGFDPDKRTGYSIGINFPPDWGEGQALSLQKGDERVLEPGMVFHVPSTVRIYGEAFVGTSETILVTAGGREVLTDCPPRDLILIT